MIGKLRGPGLRFFSAVYARVRSTGGLFREGCRRERENLTDGKIAEQQQQVHAETRSEADDEGPLEGRVTPDLVQKGQKAGKTAKLGVNCTHVFRRNTSDESRFSN